MQFLGCKNAILCPKLLFLSKKLRLFLKNVAFRIYLPFFNFPETYGDYDVFRPFAVKERPSFSTSWLCYCAHLNKSVLIQPRHRISRCCRRHRVRPASTHTEALKNKAFFLPPANVQSNKYTREACPISPKMFSIKYLYENELKGVLMV